MNNSYPAVCRAGYFLFSPNQCFMNECVQSRGLYWCKSGKGRFEVNGTSYNMEPGDLYVLPWNRRIIHYPDATDPMHTGHVHVIPDYDPGTPWIPDVPHDKSDVEFDAHARRDVQWPELNEVHRLKIKANEPFGLLLDYVIRWYIQSSGENEEEARALGFVVVKELIRKSQETNSEPSDYPEELERMIIHIKNGFHLAPTVAELADLIGRSRSHVLKLFQKHVGISPKSFIIETQLRQARELLLSTTLTIAEVGQKVGISDPYHFSKLFHFHIGLSPTDYRQKHGPVSKLYKPKTRPAPGKPVVPATQKSS